MDIKTIGRIIRRERKACGLSQKALAEASNISRVTLVNLESGNVGDIGAVKLSDIAENVGISLFSGEKNMDYMKLILGNINTSYKNLMSESDLKEFMVHGQVKPGFEGQVFHLIEETPISLVSGAIKQLSSSEDIQAKSLWKILASVAHKIKSSKPIWSSIG